jgi:lysophospholipase L1-like esterase
LYIELFINVMPMLSSIVRYTLLLLLFSPLLAGCEKAKETPVVNTSPSVILALGDSLTAGLGVDVLDTYPAQLEERLKQD